MNGGMAGLILIIGLVGFVVGVWALVLWFRFLSAGRRAFERYLFMTSDPIRPAAPVSPRR